MKPYQHEHSLIILTSARGNASCMNMMARVDLPLFRICMLFTSPLREERRPRPGPRARPARTEPKAKTLRAQSAGFLGSLAVWGLKL